MITMTMLVRSLLGTLTPGKTVLHTTLFYNLHSGVVYSYNRDESRKYEYL